MPKFVDLTGMKFNRLTVIERVENKGRNVMWNCLCDCGNSTVVSSSHLTSGHTKSCGCIKNTTRENLIDLKGKRFGKLTVLNKEKPHITAAGAYTTMWKCRCDCGNTACVSSQSLRSGNTQSCGCYRNEKVSETNRKDLTGKKYGKLSVIRYLEKEEKEIRGYNWLCRCDCGNYVKANAYKLKTGHTSSCGCLRTERIRKLNKKYENTDKRLYGVYKSMLNRCYNKHHKEYNNYGGRGITVCEEWLGEYGFDVFSKWAYSTGYKPNSEFFQCTLDRTQVNKNYCPENCRWITNKEQQNNRRNCRYIEHNGEIKTIAQWAEYFGISYNKAYWHLGKNNRTVQELIDNYLG